MGGARRSKGSIQYARKCRGHPLRMDVGSADPIQAPGVSLQTGTTGFPFRGTRLVCQSVLIFKSTFCTRIEGVAKPITEKAVWKSARPPRCRKGLLTHSSAEFLCAPCRRYRSAEGRRHRRSPSLQNLRCTSAKEGCLIFRLMKLEQSPICGAKPETMRSQRHISIRYEDLSAECTGNRTRAYMCM